MSELEAMAATDGETPVGPAALRLENVVRTYDEAAGKLEILKGTNLTIWPGEIVALVAPSGTGKSTLLHLAGLLERPDAGEVYIGGVAAGGLSDDARTRMRRVDIGFVYQFHHLLPEFSALENVAMPLLIRRVTREDAEARAREVLAEVGLAHRLSHHPGELSGGERQRAAVARALVTSPACVLADEPTGNLDRQTAERVFEVMLAASASRSTAFVIVTHDPQLAARADRCLVLRDGCLRET